MSIRVKFQEFYRPMPRTLFTQNQTQDLGLHLLIGAKRLREKPAGVTLGILLTSLSSM